MNKNNDAYVTSPRRTDEWTDTTDDTWHRKETLWRKGARAFEFLRST